MSTRGEPSKAGGRWIDYEGAAAALRSGRAAKILARWDSPEERQRAVLGVVSEVFRAATSVRSGHQWAERIVAIHYPDATSRKRHFAVQALRLYTLQGVPVGWNTALSVILTGDGLISSVGEGVAALAYADRIYRAVVGTDSNGTEGRGGSLASHAPGRGGSTLFL